MSKSYSPPFTVTPKAVSLVAGISEAVGRLSLLVEPMALRLRRLNRIRTIQGSLAIEGNTLRQEQITAILAGKRVIAPPREIQEVRNAIQAYDQLPTWQPWKEADLLDCHAILMSGLLDAPGKYRSGGVGIMAGKEVVHMAPSAERVQFLMGDLLRWLKTTQDHPLIASSVFHYEFEFIHLFADGNGRLGRLWQTLILSRRHPLFADIPVESLVHTHQQEYYQALNASSRRGDSAPFIEFILTMVREAMVSVLAPQVEPQVTPQVARLLAILSSEMSRDEIQNALNLRDRKSFRVRYLAPALAEGLIEMTIPDKPNSRLQKYRLTAKGKVWLRTHQAGNQ